MEKHQHFFKVTITTSFCYFFFQSQMYHLFFNIIDSVYQLPKRFHNLKLCSPGLYLKQYLFYHFFFQRRNFFLFKRSTTFFCKKTMPTTSLATMRSSILSFYCFVIMQCIFGSSSKPSKECSTIWKGYFFGFFLTFQHHYVISSSFFLVIKKNCSSGQNKQK